MNPAPAAPRPTRPRQRAICPDRRDRRPPVADHAARKNCPGLVAPAMPLQGIADWRWSRQSLRI